MDTILSGEVASWIGCNEGPLLKAEGELNELNWSAPKHKGKSHFPK